MVTGGGGGIGSGILFSLIKSGFKRFAIVDIDREKAESVAKQCKDKGAEDVICIIQDLAKVEEACPKVIKEAIDHFGSEKCLYS